MSKRIALFGGSFNPPGKHHRNIARLMAEKFDQVIVVPCGPRPDKLVSNDVPPTYRAAMTDQTFRGMDKVRVDLFDLEAQSFTRSHTLDRRFSPQGEVWHVLDADFFVGLGSGQSTIQRLWERGPQFLREGRFAVIQRPDSPLDKADLPPQSQVFELDFPEGYQSIRQCIFNRQNADHLVLPEVLNYIERHGLYRGTHPLRTTRLPLDEVRPMVIASSGDPRARELASTFERQEEADPNLIVVIGGDGTMLRAIRQNWRRRVPFYGINAGHIGFLLNTTSPVKYLSRSLVLEQLPLLRVEAKGPDCSRQNALAFNDAWVERATGQTAWLRVTIDGQHRLPRLVADGALISTAAGSTSYARAMGASPLPMNTPALLLVGSNVLRPAFWKPVVLPLDASIEFNTLDPDKRPLRGFIDGVPQGELRSMRARVSNIAAVELAFEPKHNPADKLAQIQFPLPED